MFDYLSDSISGIISKFITEKKITEKNIGAVVEQMKDSLLEADVPYEVVISFIQDLKKELVGIELHSSLKPAEQFIAIVKKKLTEFLTASGTDFVPHAEKKTVVIMMGLQGSGKTTTIGKLSYYLKDSLNFPEKILTASLDYYRPAAREQLALVAESAGIEYFKAESSEPISGAKEVMNFFKTSSHKILFVDTAGRMQIDSVLLDELKQIKAICKPDYSLLVLDAMTGQESLSVAKMFNTEVGFDWAVLSKADSQARSGAAFAFAYSLQKAVLFVGTGEKKEQLERFHPERVAGKILGMGDLETLLEQAEKKIKIDEQKRVEKAFLEGKFTFADFANQMEMMGKLGPLSQLLRYVPGVPKQAFSPEMLSQAEKEMKVFKAAFNSMTKKERINAVHLNASRRGRICKGAGITKGQLDQFLQKFEETKQFAKLFKRMGQFPGFK